MIKMSTPNIEPTYLSKEYMSSKLFWIGVPDRAQRYLALNLHTAIAV